MVGGGRAYYSAADYYTLRLFWHRAEASGVHASQCSQCSVHDAAGWVGRLSAELLGSIAAGIIARVDGSTEAFSCHSCAATDPTAALFSSLLAFASVLQVASPCFH